MHTFASAHPTLTLLLFIVPAMALFALASVGVMRSSQRYYDALAGFRRRAEAATSREDLRAIRFGVCEYHDARAYHRHHSGAALNLLAYIDGKSSGLPRAGEDRIVALQWLEFIQRMEREVHHAVGIPPVNPGFWVLMTDTEAYVEEISERARADSSPFISKTCDSSRDALRFNTKAEAVAVVDARRADPLCHGYGLRVVHVLPDGRETDKEAA